MLISCFKPYKGVSSNLYLCLLLSFLTLVSNPIREYLQIYSFFYPFLLLNVSNPIREYLQISEDTPLSSLYVRFKPYKGVSSNNFVTSLEEPY